MFKIILLCLSSVCIQSITSQCIRPLNAVSIDGYGNPNIAYEYAPWASEMTNGYGLSLANLAANGCGFTVQSSSPISPNGVSILSENMVIEGPLAVNGQMPFLGTIGVEGSLPASGSGVVTYSSGNGNIGITNEGFYGYPGYGMAMAPGTQAFAPGTAAFAPGTAAFAPGTAAFAPGIAPGTVGIAPGMARMASGTAGIAPMGIQGMGINNAIYGYSVC